MSCYFCCYLFPIQSAITNILYLSRHLFSASVHNSNLIHPRCYNFYYIVCLTLACTIVFYLVHPILSTPLLSYPLLCLCHFGRTPIIFLLLKRISLNILLHNFSRAFISCCCANYMGNLW